MAVTGSIKRRVFPAAAVVAAALCGCGDVDPQFQTRDSVGNLIEPAQVAFNQKMDESFGQPREMVAWEIMPVHYHGARAEAAAVEGDDGETDLSKLELDVEYETGPIAAGQTLAVTLGENVGLTRTIAAYDADSGVATLDEPLPAELDGEVVAVDPGAFLKHGQRVYSQHCLHCHGITGDGNGPTASSMVPRPRDYRDGVFKFTSTEAGRKVSREDLTRVLDHGIPGTYMPSFKLLGERNTAAVVEYVRWLSMRGETEQSVAQVMDGEWNAEILADFEDDPEGVEDFYGEFADYAEEDFGYDFADEASIPADKWEAADMANAVLTPDTPRTPMSEESIARGREIYLAGRSKCASCHGEAGLGNGPSTMDYLNLAGGPAPERGLYDSWGNPVQPRNLTRGQFRGGRRPIDIYRRIAAGIKGTPMSAFGTVLSEAEIWDLVNYVLAIGEDPKAGMSDAVAETPAEEPEADDASEEVALR